jgi:hypothetical protein
LSASSTKPAPPSATPCIPAAIATRTGMNEPFTESPLERHL